MQANTLNTVTSKQTFSNGTPRSVVGASGQAIRSSFSLMLTKMLSDLAQRGR